MIGTQKNEMGTFLCSFIFPGLTPHMYFVQSSQTKKKINEMYAAQGEVGSEGDLCPHTAVLIIMCNSTSHFLSYNMLLRSTDLGESLKYKHQVGTSRKAA